MQHKGARGDDRQTHTRSVHYMMIITIMSQHHEPANVLAKVRYSESLWVMVWG